MKIEKVSENQIRCTLTKEDLADRELKISELAYGTEKAKSLFRDMMQQASFELGFEAEDIPLMIEAIPFNDCIVLVITKVEDPEELDTRFSKFAPSVQSATHSDEDLSEPVSGADDILDLFRKIQKAKEVADDLLAKDSAKKEGLVKKTSGSKKSDPTSKKSPAKVPNVSLGQTSITKLFVFENLDNIIDFSHVLKGFYKGKSSLYKDESQGQYLLIMEQGSNSPESFNKICNIASEFGRERQATPTSLSFAREHSRAVIAEKAIQALTKL